MMEKNDGLDAEGTHAVIISNNPNLELFQAIPNEKPRSNHPTINESQYLDTRIKKIKPKEQA